MKAGSWSPFFLMKDFFSGALNIRGGIIKSKGPIFKIADTQICG